MAPGSFLATALPISQIATAAGIPPSSSLLQCLLPAPAPEGGVVQLGLDRGAVSESGVIWVQQWCRGSTGTWCSGGECSQVVQQGRQGGSSLGRVSTQPTAQGACGLPWSHLHGIQPPVT